MKDRASASRFDARRATSFVLVTGGSLVAGLSALGLTPRAAPTSVGTAQPWGTSPNAAPQNDDWEDENTSSAWADEGGPGSME